MSEKDNNKIDVMCTHTMDGKIIPMKIRLKDEDGMYQTFAVRAYRDLSVSGNYTFFNPLYFGTFRLHLSVVFSSE